jgi:hypothetical protein
MRHRESGSAEEGGLVMATCEACGGALKLDDEGSSYYAYGGLSCFGVEHDETEDLKGASICPNCVTADNRSGDRIAARRALAARIRSRRQSPAPVEKVKVGDFVILDNLDKTFVGTLESIGSESLGSLQCHIRRPASHRLARDVPNWYAPLKNLRYSPPPEVKPSEQKSDVADALAYAFESAKQVKVGQHTALASVGLACALIEAMRRDFAVLYALRPYMSPGDLRAALREPPL